MLKILSNGVPTTSPSKLIQWLFPPTARKFCFIWRLNLNDFDFQPPDFVPSLLATVKSPLSSGFFFVCHYLYVAIDTCHSHLL